MADSEENNKGSLSRTIQSIEQKPHKLYIRYLLSLKWSPRKIRASLYKFGLSSSTDEALEKYYNAIIRPIIKKHKLSYIYQDYDNSLANKQIKGGYKFPSQLNFKLTFGDSIDNQIQFLKFIEEIGCSNLWLNEFYNFYGKRENVPQDPDTGKILIPEFKQQSSIPWSIIQSPKRYLVDELILEGLNSSRIIAHMKEEHGLNIKGYEINMYRSSFFNVNLIETKDQLKFMEIERQNIMFHIKNVDIQIMRTEQGKSDESDSSIPDLLIEKKALYSRLADLDATIRTLNSIYSEEAANKLNADQINYEETFKAMFAETVKKFNAMSRHNDRDVVNPLFKLTKMAAAQFEMLERAKEMDARGSGQAQAEMIELVTERDEDIAADDKETKESLAGYDQANVGFEDGVDVGNIMGVENLGQSQGDENE